MSFKTYLDLGKTSSQFFPFISVLVLLNKADPFTSKLKDVLTFSFLDKVWNYFLEWSCLNFRFFALNFKIMRIKFNNYLNAVKIEYFWFMYTSNKSSKILYFNIMYAPRNVNVSQ